MPVVCEETESLRSASGGSEVFLTAFEQCERSKDGSLFLAHILNSAWVSQALMSLTDIGYPFS